MATVNRNDILELLAAGKISAAEAAELLNQARSEPGAPAETTATPEATLKAAEAAETAGVTKPETAGTKEPTWFHIRVRNLETGQNKVTVNIPLRMFKFGMRIGRRFSPELAGLDWDEIQDMVANMESGVLVEVQDEEDSEHVQIYVD